MQGRGCRFDPGWLHEHREDGRMTKEDEQEKLGRAMIAYALEQFAQGRTRQAVVADLQAKGVPLPVATLIVQIAGSPNVLRASARFDLLLGAVLAAIGIGLSVWSYTQAKPGGSYVVVVGLILAGLGMVWRGLNRAP